MIEYSKKGKPAVTLFFATTQSLIKPKISDEDELSYAKWVTIEEAKKLLNGFKGRDTILNEAVDFYTFNSSEENM